MSPATPPTEHEVITIVKACARCTRPLTVQVFRGNASAPNTTALHLGCAMALEGH